MTTSSIRRTVLNLLARYHLWSGRRAYRLGRMRTAGRHFRDAIHCGHESFEAYLLLGKIYYREDDMSRAATYFARARASDPARYLIEGFPDDFITSLREGQNGSSRPEYRIVIQSTRTGASEPVIGGDPADRVERPVTSSASYGDFASRDEWLRHRDSPPLSPGEGVDVDWDAEARELFGNDAE
jgi:tetratricopeptide (TPR) repeat protein